MNSLYKLATITKEPFRYSKIFMSMLNIHKPILYGDEASPPVRFVMMTASVLGVEYNFHRIDLFAGENQSEFYKRINPLQKVPAFQLHSEHVIKDSHAIAIYLCQSQSHKDLYPVENFDKCAKVNEMLFFNSTTLFPIDSAIFSDYFAGKWPIDKKAIEQWHLSLDYLDKILTKSKWLAGHELTISDICCGATVSSLQLLIPPSGQHTKVNNWMIELNRLPCFNINENGLHRLKGFVDTVRKLNA